MDAHANGLLDIGINSGDTIGIWMDECPERHVSLLACAKAGLKVADIGIYQQDKYVYIYSFFLMW